MTSTELLAKAAEQGAKKVFNDFYEAYEQDGVVGLLGEMAEWRHAIQSGSFYSDVLVYLNGNEGGA